MVEELTDGALDERVAGFGQPDGDGATGLTANVISPGYIAGTEFFRGRLTGQRRASLIGGAHTTR